MKSLNILLLGLFVACLTLVNVGTASAGTATYYPSCVGKHGSAGCTGTTNTHRPVTHNNSTFYPSCVGHRNDGTKNCSGK